MDASHETVENYRQNARSESRLLVIAMLVAMGCYFASAQQGPGGLGWTLLIVGVAASFAVVMVGIGINEQEQTAALLQYMLEIAERQVSGEAAAAPSARDRDPWPYPTGNRP